MDWNKEGLLEGLDDDKARADRGELLDELHEQGVSVDELRKAVEEERLVLLPVERMLAGKPRYTAEEIAEKSGFDLEHVAEFRRALGLAMPEQGARAFGEDDLEVATDAQRLRDMGFPFEDSLEVTRVLGRGMSRYAEALRVLFAQTFLEPGDSEADLARRLAAAAGELMPMSGRMLEHAFSLHMRQLLSSDYIGLTERISGKVTDTSDTAVAFADWWASPNSASRCRSRSSAASRASSGSWPGGSWTRRCGWSSRSATR